MGDNRGSAHPVGDPRQFGELVRPHLARLYRYALRLSGDPETASDLAQDALVKAYQKLGQYDPARPILPWLLALVRNGFIDRVRSFDPLRAPDLPDEVPAGPAGGDPLGATASAERAAAVEKALLRVPPDQRACLVLFHVEGLTLEEVAEAEGVPVGTVKSRLHRGRQALAEALGPLAGEL